MSLERSITDLYKNPPKLFGEQLIKQVQRLERLRVSLQQSPFLRDQDVQTAIDLLKENHYTDPSLPEIASAAVEYQLSAILEFPQDVNWSLGLLIANKSAHRGGISLLSEIFTTAQEAKFPSGVAVSDEKREYLQILNADPSGIELAQHLKGVYNEGFFYNTSHSLLNTTCLIVGSSMASDLYTAFAKNHRKNLGV